MPRNYERTPISNIEQALLDSLSDGHPHTVESLRRCLSDEELSDDLSVAKQISNLRKILNPKGKDIVKRNGTYRMVRLINDEG
jgi:hypothetical protein